ncbi:MAG: glycosyltransferase [Planctomycetes bacterium]|nr:glycosyltransferase [Planctomycetota bacterium]
MYPKVKLVHYNPDDPFGRHNKSRYWKTFCKAIPEYNVHFVPRKVNVNEYKKLGAQLVIQSIPFWGYCPEIHKPMQLSEEDKKQMGGPVGFIGSWEYERAQSLFFLAKNNLLIRVWGNEWKKCKAKHPNLRIEYKSIWGSDYARAICAFDINLCFLRKANRDLQTTRSIEIPACGSLMMAERSTEHLKLFEEGKEAVFFSSDEELLEKVKYYLSHLQERQRIAVAGRKRCLTSGYSNCESLKRMLQIACESKGK